CLHGKCIATSSAYTCKCVEGYVGTYCDRKNESSSSCRVLKCIHGQCKISAQGEPYCDCDPSYSGEHCDRGQGGTNSLDEDGEAWETRATDKEMVEEKELISRPPSPGVQQQKLGYHCMSSPFGCLASKNEVKKSDWNPCVPLHWVFHLELKLCGKHSSENLCQGEIIREFIRKQQGSISCVSMVKVPRVECHGSCGNHQCCTALRSKRRKYGFQCVDGSSFTEELERHVECGCA
ncbi:hypothetical protein EYD10_04972, partial [Varanus komodoensis]